MRKIFVFTAGNAEARAHLVTSIKTALPTSMLVEELGPDAERLVSKLPDPNGFYAWGAMPGPRNEVSWENLRPGDVVLTVYDNVYRYVSTVIDKVRSPSLATRIWGSEGGRTWEYIYLLSRPQAVEVAVTAPELVEALRAGYRGFTEISDERIRALAGNYGSVEAFIEQVFGIRIHSKELERDIAEAEAAAERRAESSTTFDATDDSDRRRRVIAEVVRRRGQPKFRRALLEAYDGRCAITGCVTEAVLEAAHIVPYRGDSTNHISNGLLLRADIHTLFDLGLISIDHATRAVLVSKDLLGTEYERLRGKVLLVPSDTQHQPNLGALAAHRKGTEL